MPMVTFVENPSWIKTLLILFAWNHMLNGTQLTSSTGNGVACPNDTVVFTCLVIGRNSLSWTVDPPTGLMGVQQITRIITSNEGSMQLPASGVEGFMFQPAVTNNSINGNLTSTLTTITEVSRLNGSVVRCIGDTPVSMTISVAESPSSPSTVMMTSQQNGVSSSIVTLEWDSTGDVSVSYVLIISPTPLSGSPVIVETTSAQITVSYNTLYNVTITAVNCAGKSSVIVIIPSVVACPSNPPPADRVNINDAVPLLALVGSTLSFSCNGETVTATCESDGQWSPDPTTYNCSSVVTCGSPAVPSRGSVDFKGQTSPFSIDSVVNFRCDEGLFPAGDMPSTCESMGGVGTWKPDTNIVCRDKPANCSLPLELCNGGIVDYERLNETVSEGTVLTYQCENGLSLTGPNTITCTNAGVWSTEPEAIMCVLVTEVSTVAPSFSNSATLAISVVITFIITLVIGFLTGLLVMHIFSRKKVVYFPATEGQANAASTAPVGPVYEEVSPKEDIELNTNQAYGPLGL